jgi:hypothetical protein
LRARRAAADADLPPLEPKKKKKAPQEAGAAA